MLANLNKDAVFGVNLEHKTIISSKEYERIKKNENEKENIKKKETQGTNRGLVGWSDCSTELSLLSRAVDKPSYSNYIFFIGWKHWQNQNF